MVLACQDVSSHTRHLARNDQFRPNSKPNLEKLPRIAASGKIAPGNRQVYFSKTGGWINAQVYRRDTLAVGSRISGPAVIEEYGATTVIEPGDELVVGKFGEIQVMVGD